MDSNQRKSFRILVPEGQEQAVLCLGRRSVTVRVVDASAGGFALATSESLPVKCGDNLRLRTGAGWHQVRVVRDESYTDGMLLGLERLGDIDDPAELAALRPCWKDYFFLPYAQGNVGGTRLSGLLMGGIVLCVVMVAATTVLTKYRPPKRNESFIPAADQVFANLTGRADKDAKGARPLPVPSPPAPSASSAKVLRGLDSLIARAREDLPAGEGPDLAAAWNEVAEAVDSRLELSSNQRQQLDSIFAETASAGDLQEIGDRILDILSHDQARQLASLAD